jgi:hypothetical protein
MVSRTDKIAIALIGIIAFVCIVIICLNFDNLKALFP